MKEEILFQNDDMESVLRKRINALEALVQAEQDYIQSLLRTKKLLKDDLRRMKRKAKRLESQKEAVLCFILGSTCFMLLWYITGALA
jgi:hypothetical protein